MPRTLRVEYPGTIMHKLAAFLAIAIPLAASGAGPESAHSWRRTETTLALVSRSNVLWQAVADPAQGKPYFHPLATPGGVLVSDLRPADHLWHRGLWWSWKLINGLNYWEEDPKTGRGEAATDLLNWTAETHPDGSARLTFALSYHPWNGTPVLIEKRLADVSAPTETGYTLDWVSEFTAVTNVVLDRSPAGYAGFSLRLGPDQRKWTFTDSEGRSGQQSIHGHPARWVKLSAGTNAPAVAIFDHSDNLRHPARWYVDQSMPYFSPAPLFAGPFEMAAGKKIAFRYRVFVTDNDPGDTAMNAITGTFERLPPGHAAPVLVGADYQGPVDSETQRHAALGVIRRLLGEHGAARFDVQIIPAEKGLDVFEVESKGKTIILRGSSGLAACRGLKWYLNTLCHCSVSWRGDNLNLPATLPSVPSKVRESSPFQYRDLFNYCAYGYSMAWWHWPEWERMLDVLALNGINLPLCPLGQEKAWQETYREFGLSNADLNDFFAGPAWFPFQWMGCLDGWGGPLSQSVIEGHYELQRQILARARSLGMTPILQGFTGHVPKALKRKHPDLKVNQLEWQGFPPTDTLDWADPRFKQIGAKFLNALKTLYGTDHYYAMDPFIEMIPHTTNLTFISNMAKSLFSAMDEADHQGIWVLQTWFCKSPQIVESYWTTDRTKHFFDAVPDQRLLALELQGEDWYWTGWKAQNGYYGKPWVWCAVQNFGDQVDLYGGLPQIFDNYRRMQASPNKGNPVGLGIAMEGLDYNPVVFEFLFDMMWGDGVTDLAKWREDYVLKRYGKDLPAVRQAWDILYATRYTIAGRTGSSPLCGDPGLWGDASPEMDLVTAWKLLLSAADELKDCPAYQFDLVNLGREVMGNYAPHYSFLAKQAYEKKDLQAFQTCSSDMLQYIRDFDRLMGTSEHFLLGRWTEGARSWGTTEAEKTLFQWGAKRQITDWGGNIGSYAIKEWSGYIKDRMLPLWELYLGDLEKSLKENRPFNADDYSKKAALHSSQWPHVRSNIPSEPQGNAIEVSREMWLKYGKAMLEKGLASGYLPPSKPTPPGIAVGKPITATSVYGDRRPEFAVDGQSYDREASWWSKEPASLTIDLETKEKILGFQVYPYWDGSRYYQYTIETSLDGKNWTMAVDMSKNTQAATPAGHLHNFKLNMPAGFDCRYVRLNMLKNSANPGAHVVEFKLFGAIDEL